MTPQEAHEYMENEIRCVQRSKICDRDCAKCELVKEDKPLIEAYGIAVLALEKQIPKKRADGWYGKNTECPICHIVASNKYCSNCGQALDWSDTE